MARANLHYLPGNHIWHTPVKYAPHFTGQGREVERDERRGSIMARRGMLGEPGEFLTMSILAPKTAI